MQAKLFPCDSFSIHNCLNCIIVGVWGSIPVGNSKWGCRLYMTSLSMGCKTQPTNQHIAIFLVSTILQIWNEVSFKLSDINIYTVKPLL